MADINTQLAIEARAKELQQQIDKEKRSLDSILTSGKIYQQFDVSNDIIENQKELVTAPLWSTEQATLGSFFTSSVQSTLQKQYYHEIFSTGSSQQYPEFSIAYGHRLGSGSLTGSAYTYPSKAIYGQYRQLLLDDGQRIFEFSDGTSTDSIYAININRARFKDRVDPGNWELNLAKLNGSGSVSGSNEIVTLIDDSGDQAQTVSQIIKSGRVYNIVSGSLNSGIYSPTTVFGKFYPDFGVLVMDGTKLDTYVGFNTNTDSNSSIDNAYTRLYTSISGSSVINSSSKFEGRSSEVITSTYYFCRVKNGEFNYSNNPSFKTGSLGELRYGSFIGDPKVYITTVGLYNDRQELLAVAKLSQPILKTFSSEISIKCKIDW